jgi:hypothetical protein
LFRLADVERVDLEPFAEALGEFMQLRARPR